MQTEVNDLARSFVDCIPHPPVSVIRSSCCNQNPGSL
ncbi:hypothetical protein CYA_1356 [Synechococcus sp. JA-3-3Ab]|nr:hypothetical protein CYA_1356 [Synechococcus sp. JA-3-3Ab]